MSITSSMNMLRPHKWKLYDSREAGLLPDGVLRRCVNDISHADMNELVAFCERFGDVTNFEVNANIAWGFVRDPWVDGAPRDGVWRLLSTRVERMDAADKRVGAEGTRWRLVQELAEGWLESLRGDECRLVEGRRLSGDAAANAGGEKFYTLRWVGVSPDRVEALADELASVEVLDEILYRRVGNDGLTVTEKLEGEWRHLASKGSLAEDGSGVVEWTVADSQYVLSGFASWLGSRQSERIRIWNVPEALAQGLIDAAKAQGKSAEGVSYDDQNGLVNLVIEVPNLVGVSLAGVKVGENCDSTGYASFAWGTGDEDALPVPGSIPAGTSYQRRLNENGDGTFTVSLTWEVRKYRDVPEYDSEFRADQGTKRKEWKGWTDQNLGTALNAVTGKVVRVTRNIREDCSVDIDRDVVTPLAQTVTHASEARADRTAEAVIATNADAQAEATPVAGKVVQASSRENEFGKFDNQVTTVTPLAQSGDWTFGRGASKPAIKVYFGSNMAALPDLGTEETQSAGVRKNEFDLLDFNLITTPAVTEFSIRKAFKPYTVVETLPNMVERQVINGVPYKRTYTNVSFRAAGNSNEGTAMGHVATCNYQVTFNPMGNGKFFHAKGIKRDEPGDWVEDGTLP